MKRSARETDGHADAAWPPHLYLCRRVSSQIDACSFFISIRMMLRNSRKLTCKHNGFIGLEGARPWCARMQTHRKCNC